jgi:hypothetical protein
MILKFENGRFYETEVDRGVTKIEFLRLLGKLSAPVFIFFAIY